MSGLNSIRKRAWRALFLGYVDLDVKLDYLGIAQHLPDLTHDQIEQAARNAMEERNDDDEHMVWEIDMHKFAEECVKCLSGADNKPS